MTPAPILLAAMIVAAPATANASDATRSTGGAKPDPERVIERITENTTTAPDGTVVPSTGRAKPVENWFGCKPGNTRTSCDAAKPNAQAQSSKKINQPN